ncbi:hypothetical protein WN093_05525 [Gammaproteobacteria bacterium AS21]|jgi:hypothetical protein
MTNLYDDQFKRDESGRIDFEYYTVQAGRIRSQFIAAFFVRLYRSFKSLCKTLIKTVASPVDNFLMQKAVK